MIKDFSINKSGYLKKDFLLFHLKDKNDQHFEYHYHDFNKIIIFLSGKVTYLIEGKSYFLKPWDILLVNNHDIHKPIIDPSETYERIVIWANSSFINTYDYDDCDLLNCFKLANKKSFNLIRLEAKFQNNIKELISHLEDSLNSNEFGNSLLSSTLFLQLIIYLNRIHLNNDYINDTQSLKFDKQIEDVLNHINNNLEENLSIEALCQKFFISKYYLMHKFKKETGYTLHNYILQKRLMLSKELIKTGMPITKACTKCGFNDYSSFLRAFKKMFNYSPSYFYYSKDN